MNIEQLESVCMVQEQIIKRITEENERFRKALEKYADPETHSMDPTGEIWYADYFDYKTAQDALAGIDPDPQVLAAYRDALESK